MSRPGRAWLLFVTALAGGRLAAAPATRVELQGAAAGGEVCRFRAGRADDPLQRWLESPDVTCVPAGSPVTFPRGLWNVFGRSGGAVSVDRLLIDGASPPPAMTIALVPAAALVLQLPPGHTGVLYVPKRVVAFPAGDRTSVPAGEELWLIVLAKSMPLAVFVIPPLEPASTRAVDARDLAGAADALGWTQLPEADRKALAAATGVTSPSLRIKSAEKESGAAALPPAEALDGALVLFRSVAAGPAELQLDGHGWLAVRRKITIEPKGLTLIREPIAARAAARLVVYWNAQADLASLDSLLGSCEPSHEAPRLLLTVSSCAQRPGADAEAASCQPIRTETLMPDLSYGTIAVGDVPPGLYRAELRFGKLPPVTVTEQVAPLQQQPIFLRAAYLTAYGSVTRGGQPLGDGAQIEFPGGGVGFLPRDQDEYHAVLRGLLGIDAKIDIVTCSGERAVVFTDRPLRPNARFDIDIPDNSLTVSVVDTFTREPLREATLRYTVMSLRVPRAPIFTRQLVQAGGEESVAGRFTIAPVPEREIRLQARCRGYKTQDLDPFSMGKSEKKDVEIQMVPLSGSRGRVISAHPFAKATIFWFSSGSETERADLDPDGTFYFEGRHLPDETMVIVSLSHPLWVAPAPQVEHARPLEIRFPDAAQVRETEISIPGMPLRMATLIGIVVGGLRVPAPALGQHLMLRDIRPFLRGEGPLRIPALAETGPITILRGPSVSMVSYAAAIDTMALRDFPVTASLPLAPGTDTVVFGPKP